MKSNLSQKMSCKVNVAVVMNSVIWSKFSDAFIAWISSCVWIYMCVCLCMHTPTHKQIFLRKKNPKISGKAC
jgi:hypothetical protein